MFIQLYPIIYFIYSNESSISINPKDPVTNILTTNYKMG